MPAIARLMEGAGDQPGFALFGKHPGHGDFVVRGVGQPLLSRLEGWLDAGLGQARDQLADRWDAVFDSAPMLRFWLGAGLTGQAALAGVMIPSRDKVGRRFPLLVLRGAEAMPPTLAPDQGAHDALATGIAQIMAGPLVDLPDAVLPEAGGDQGHAFWATNPVAGAADLLAGIAATDHARAAQTRSYWWVAPDEARAAAVFACAGFPDGAALAWLFSGVARPEPELETQEEQGQTVD